MKYCKKLVKKGSGPIPSVLFGVIEREDDLTITFRTKNKTYVLNRELVLEISDTNKIFEGLDGLENGMEKDSGGSSNPNDTS